MRDFRRIRSCNCRRLAAHRRSCRELLKCCKTQIRNPIYILIFDRGRYLFSLVNDLIRRFNTGARAAKAEELHFDTGEEQKAFDISCMIADVFDRRDVPSAVSVSAAQFERLIEECRSCWGEVPLIISVANAICHIPGRKAPRTKDYDLVATDRALCDRIRVAKSRGRNIAWWQTQISRIKTPIDRFLFHLIFWTWAPSSTCIEMAVEIGTLLDALEPEEWLSLSTSFAYR